MTAIASTDVTITLSAQNRDIVPGARKNVSLVTIAFGNGALTYSTGGVPLPAIGNFGMKKQLQGMLIQQPYGSLFDFRYDATNHKIVILIPATGTHAEHGTGAITAVSFTAVVIGE